MLFSFECSNCKYSIWKRKRGKKTKEKSFLVSRVTVYLGKYASFFIISVFLFFFFKFNFDFLFLTARQGFTPCKGGSAGERIERTNHWTNRGRIIPIRNRWNHCACIQWLLQRRDFDFQGFFVLRGSLWSFTRHHRDFKIPPSKDTEIRNGDTRWKNPQRSYHRRWERSQHRISPFLAKCTQVFARKIKF